MPLEAPYRVTFYGTNEQFDSDANSEVAKSSITAVTYQAQGIDCFVLRPFDRYESEITTTGGSLQRESHVKYQRFEIATTRLTNKLNDYADITSIYDDIMTVMDYEYKYLEVNRYIRALHTVNKLIKGVVKKCETIPVVNRVYLEIEFEKERP